MRLLIASATILLGLALVACGEDSRSPSSTPTAHAPTTAPDVTKGERSGGVTARAFILPGGDNTIPTFGSEGAAAERAAAEAVLGEYLAARAAGEWSAACARLAQPVAKQLESLAEGRGCPEAYRGLYGQAGASALTDPFAGSLASLRVKGQRGFALWVGRRDQKYVMPMIREGGRWHVTQLSPLPYPLAGEGP